MPELLDDLLALARKKPVPPFTLTLWDGRDVVCQGISSITFAFPGSGSVTVIVAGTGRKRTIIENEITRLRVEDAA